MNNFQNQFSEYIFQNLGFTRLPTPPISNNDKLKINLKENDSNSALLRKLCHQGFEEKLKNGQIPKDDYQIYIDRCNLELNTFDELHFTDYILLVWKVVEKAREMGVFIDYGRGSVASSLVSWLLKITGCDPIKYKLFFSRFVSKARAKSKIINNEIWLSTELCPDIDLNLGEGKEKIIEWLKELYPNRLCKISNVSTLSGKILVKDVYKCVEEATEDESKLVADLVERRFGVVQDIEDIYNGKKDDTGEWIIEPNQDFREWVDTHGETYNICLKLRDLIRQTSTHASGYLISNDEITEHSPLILDSEKNVVSAYTMDYAQCLKLDLLGLDTNSIINNILKEIPEDVEKLNLENDSIIYDQFQNNNLLPYGLYQISAPCAYRVCQSLKPKDVLELSHVNAIARPVALVYEKPYKEGNSKCPHPLYEEALKWTNYQPLYQEQTLMCLKAIGFDDVEAEQARRVFAKKKHNEVDEQIEIIKKKLLERNLPKEAGDVVIKLAKDGASYQFNFAHSLATSYLTALTVYLKYKYPLEFYTACLNSIIEFAVTNPIERIAQIQEELKYFNIKLAPPDLLKSNLNFTLDKENKQIVFGLGGIKGIAAKTLEKLQDFRHDYSNKLQIFESAEQCGINIASLSVLIQAGAMDKYLNNSTRTKLNLEAQTYSLLTPREKKRIHELSEQFNNDLFKIISYLKTNKDEKGKVFIKESRILTIRKKYDKYKKIYEQNSQYEKLTNYFYEKLCLGYSYSHTLSSILRETYPDIIDIEESKSLLNEDRAIICGEIQEVRYGIARNEKKTKYVKIKISDSTGSIDCMVFDYKNKKGEIIEQIGQMELENGGKFEEKWLVIAEGKKKTDSLFCSKIIRQEALIYTKLADLKNEKISEKSEKSLDKSDTV